MEVQIQSQTNETQILAQGNCEFLPQINQQIEQNNNLVVGHFCGELDAAITNVSWSNSTGLAEVQAAHQLMGQQVLGLDNPLKVVETQSGQLAEFQRGQPSGNLHQTLGGVDQLLQIVERTCQELVGDNQVQTTSSDQSARVRSMEQQISIWDHKWSDVTTLKMQQIQLQENLGCIARVEQQVSKL